MTEKIRRSIELPADLYTELEAAAAADERSINAMIIRVLRQGLLMRKKESR
jgi:hypothetical protein